MPPVPKDESKPPFGDRRTTVSHANKSYKGHAARLLASTRRRPKDTKGVLAVLADAGLRVERAGDTSLLLVVPRGM